jgi:outer membrane protein assembly factor BamE (lipoprotein component of BamABCDE complex)
MPQKLLMALFAALFLGACAMQAGINFDGSSVRNIQPNQTTKDDLRKSFGEPTKRGIDSGYETWTYLYEKLHRESIRRLPKLYSKELYVVFRADGTVLSYSYNTNIPEEYDLLDQKLKE